MMDEEENLDYSKVVHLSMVTINEYFNGYKRPLICGEDLVKAGWIHAIGVNPPPARNKITGLVVQTSNMTNFPHEVTMENLDKPVNEWKLHCTCKAGQGEKCKHVAACLIHIYR